MRNERLVLGGMRNGVHKMLEASQRQSEIMLSIRDLMHLSATSDTYTQQLLQTLEDAGETGQVRAVLRANRDPQLHRWGLQQRNYGYLLTILKNEHLEEQQLQRASQTYQECGPEATLEPILRVAKRMCVALQPEPEVDALLTGLRATAGKDTYPQIVAWAEIYHRETMNQIREQLLYDIGEGTYCKITGKALYGDAYLLQSGTSAQMQQLANYWLAGKVNVASYPHLLKTVLAQDVFTPATFSAAVSKLYCTTERRASKKGIWQIPLKYVLTVPENPYPGAANMLRPKTFYAAVGSVLRNEYGKEAGNWPEVFDVLGHKIALHEAFKTCSKDDRQYGEYQTVLYGGYTDEELLNGNISVDKRTEKARVRVRGSRTGDHSVESARYAVHHMLGAQGSLQGNQAAEKALQWAEKTGVLEAVLGDTKMRRLLHHLGAPDSSPTNVGLIAGWLAGKLEDDPTGWRNALLLLDRTNGNLTVEEFLSILSE